MVVLSDETVNLSPNRLDLVVDRRVFDFLGVVVASGASFFRGIHESVRECVEKLPITHFRERVFLSANSRLKTLTKLCRFQLVKVEATFLRRFELWCGAVCFWEAVTGENGFVISSAHAECFLLHDVVLVGLVIGYRQIRLSPGLTTVVIVRFSRVVEVVSVCCCFVPAVVFGTIGRNAMVTICGCRGVEIRMDKYMRVIAVGFCLKHVERWLRVTLRIWAVDIYQQQAAVNRIECNLDVASSFMYFRVGYFGARIVVYLATQQRFTNVYGGTASAGTVMMVVLLELSVVPNANVASE